MTKKQEEKLINFEKRVNTYLLAYDGITISEPDAQHYIIKRDGGMQIPLSEIIGIDAPVGIITFDRLEIEFSIVSNISYVHLYKKCETILIAILN